jgi:hypothetical protein
MVNRVAWGLTVILIVGVAFWQRRLVGDFRVDDAYITFSFSKNLAQGLGPVYSSGLRVEGYSNFLWMLAVSLGYLVMPEGDPYVWARALSLVAVGITLGATFLLAARLTDRWAAAIAAFLVVCSTDLFRGAVSGLETASYTAAVTLAAFAYVAEDPARRRWSAWALLAVALLRVEGPVYFLLFAAWEVGQMLIRQRRIDVRALIGWLLVPSSIYAAYFAWRFHYYGLPFPAPYYAKSLVTANEPFRGTDYCWNALRDSGFLAAAPFVLLAFRERVRTPATGLLAALCTVQIALAIKAGGDWMPFNRFLLPVLPAGVVLFACGLREAARGASSGTGVLTWPLRVAGAAAVLFVAVHLHGARIDNPSEQDKLVMAKDVARHTRDNLLAGVELLKYVLRKPGERLVTDYAGVFAVYTQAEIIDMWGLCNATIALRGGKEGINPIYGKECASCYKELTPDYFHANAPLLREKDAFKRHRDVVDAVFQSGAIGRYLDFNHGYATGRVLDSRSGHALFFLERRRPHVPLVARDVAPHIRVDYPFEGS